jgi:hypothetical protein
MGPMGPAMSMPLLPQWLRIVWAVALAGVLLVHVWHAWSVPGQPRWWHIGHIIMALGMMGMYLVGMAHTGLSRAGVVLFAVMTAALATTAVVFRRRERVLNPLWVASAVDTLAMTYMLLPPAAQPTGVRWVFIAYLACQTLAWALGLWDRVPVFQPAPSALGPVPATRATATTGRVQAVATAMAIPAQSGDRVLGLTAHCTPAIRVSLAVMAASMAYMLAVM